ncbi:MAG TPA: D-alanyl-D-alanine carboxypeptidase [Candidatus Blautia avicola]|uniref:serine-type D-Ala-D-Ala carboxypeptidase n=1 Tax=Candidatus Blautia avicola TaxID=2838483 RepID=A0A9D2QU51_9FIRM|nr:D-alanyl-D-alanine carboxypeptidase [Candidatus Blautia avicola]
MTGRAAGFIMAGILMISAIFAGGAVSVKAEGEELITSPHGVLMEAFTGQIIYEKDMDARVKPASITKIMTLLLIFDELEKGTLHMEDQVVTSAYAKSMGGSQVFLEEGEKQSVETMIKCIVIASGNDASVAMAEYIAGSEGEFVRRMNERAAGLGMENTHFEDCCGLTESDNHYTSAHDVAIMSRELVTRYPKVLEYSSVWMENITHETDKGASEFGLTNTNKLIRSYDGCVGLKTGSTSVAKYCVSAVAQRNGITLISVVMTAPDYKVRFADAAAMLNLGFGSCQLYTDSEPAKLPDIPVKGGVKDQVSCSYKEEFRYLDTAGTSLENIEKKILLPESVQAPVAKGDKAGSAEYYLNGEKIGSADLIFDESCREAGYLDCLKKVWGIFL